MSVPAVGAEAQLPTRVGRHSGGAEPLASICCSSILCRINCRGLRAIYFWAEECPWVGCCWLYTYHQLRSSWEGSGRRSPARSREDGTRTALAATSLPPGPARCRRPGMHGAGGAGAAAALSLAVPGAPLRSALRTAHRAPRSGVLPCAAVPPGRAVPRAWAGGSLCREPTSAMTTSGAGRRRRQRHCEAPVHGALLRPRFLLGSFPGARRQEIF